MPEMGVGEHTKLSRRRLLQVGALGVASAWAPTFRVPAAAGRSGCATPPSFPPGIELFRQGYENWAKAIVVDDLWTCSPRTAADVVRLANWARQHRWRLRPRGAMHNWSPICITADTSCEDRILLVDTTAHLTGIDLASDEPPTVRVGAGASMIDLMSWLEARRLGFVTTPATGDVTVGGGLAVGMHGAALPARGERRAKGQTYGSLANLVVSLTAVVWSRRRKRYVLRTFHRSHPSAKALLVHLGRAFVTEVTLRVARNQNLRCVSRVDIPARELFGPPGGGGASFHSFVDEAGRAEAIWFPFTEKPWFKVWSVSPEKPPESRAVDAPYNYPFSDSVPESIAELADEIISGNTALTPTFAQTEYEVVRAGLAATRSADIWGPSKNTLLYIRATTLRVDEYGFVVIANRRHIQRIVHEFATYHERRLDELRTQGRFPINGPVEIRACGLDRPGHVGLEGAEAAALAPTVPRRDHPRWDAAVWLNVLTFPGTPGEYEYYRELEAWMRSNYRGYAAVRPEWSKGWACRGDGIWKDRDTIARRIPRSFTAGRRGDEDWSWAVERLDRYDPHRIFSNRFLDRLA